MDSMNCAGFASPRVYFDALRVKIRDQASFRNHQRSHGLQAIFNVRIGKGLLRKWTLVTLAYNLATLHHGRGAPRGVNSLHSLA
jgi:hypothetical protein